MGDGVDLNGAWTALELLSCGKQTSERHRAQPSQFSPPTPNVYGLSTPCVGLGEYFVAELSEGDKETRPGTNRLSVGTHKWW
jgi:hypothetical protein